jgi:transposase
MILLAAVTVPSRTDLAVANAILAVFYTGGVWLLVIRPFWPWDWRGQPKRPKRASRERS